jgi:hypothetical protein
MLCLQLLSDILDFTLFKLLPTPTPGAGPGPISHQAFANQGNRANDSKISDTKWSKPRFSTIGRTVSKVAKPCAPTHRLKHDLHNNSLRKSKGHRLRMESKIRHSSTYLPYMVPQDTGLHHTQYLPASFNHVSIYFARLGARKRK